MGNETEHVASTELEGKLSLRPERPEDESFLFEVYAGTRQEELALTGWDAPTRTAFVQMQFKAMRQGYASQHPRAQFCVILVSGNPVGRMVVDRSEENICLVDMALLVEHRGKGIGTILMRELLAEAARVAKPIRLHVFKQSRPIRWYERLGFCKTGDNGAYDRMEWHPGGAG
jgi:ribosomal protein S18 acetylase RimI-like enzyme